MERKKQATTASHPRGACEKLFNAFQPKLQPLRRLTLRQQEAKAATAASPLPPPLPQPAPPPKELTQHGHKAKDHKEKKRPLPSPAPPKAELMPVGTVPEAVPPPAAKTKRGINERVDSYIVRTKEKIRSGSGLGRVFSSK
ncbi:uncharacterized protein A4U43_C07F3560 [Asparagus officinalis]|uniref:Uncharacterized protein n=1 Tax=Asparagus officinalis TaxID=4686 RepID=A0A5P1E973_ASPOF|nr:uncharacterized protein A4U43_C07F3560 [Asparagus officinalis]